MLPSNINIQKILLDLGYDSDSNKTSVIFANVIDQVFFGFGSTIQNGLITEAKKQILPTDFKYPYYSLVKRSILDFLGPKGGQKILDEINAELKRHTKIEGSIEEILNELSRREIISKLTRLKGHEHIIYLWTKKNTRDEIIREMLENAKGPKGAFSIDENLFSDVKTTLYSKLLSEKEKAVDKGLQMIKETHQKNNQKDPTVIVGFDGTKWLESGLQKEFLDLENSANKFLSENLISGICAYQLEKIPDEKTLKSFVKCHPIVLLDDPFVIYERGN